MKEHIYTFLRLTHNTITAIIYKRRKKKEMKLFLPFANCFCSIAQNNSQVDDDEGGYGGDFRRHEQVVKGLSIFLCILTTN